MLGAKKSTLVSRQSSRQSSYKSLYVNPLNDLKQDRGSNASGNGGNLSLHFCRNSVICDKENVAPTFDSLKGKENQPRKSIGTFGKNSNSSRNGSSANPKTKAVLKPSSLQLCMHMNEPDLTFGSSLFNPLMSENPMNVWDYSDSEAAPASSWTTIPNRSLLCRPLPLDIGRCTCIIVKEPSEGLDGASLYSLYTNEGQGRQDRKLAVARHKRRSGRSEFIIAQNPKGILSSSDESFLGNITANLMGSRYHIWDQGKPLDSLKKQSKRLLAAVNFMPTITTLTGSFRSMRAWIPKHQSMQLKNTTQIQHVNGLPNDWEEKTHRTHQLFSKVPYYNSNSKRYELDFRERGRSGIRIQTSVKNFQLTMEGNGRQTILLLGRIEKSKYVMDYRFPLTGYQAFCICLASIDSKLCCSM